MSGVKKTRGVPIAVLTGALLVPATAIAAVAIVGSTTRVPEAQAASDDFITTTTTTAAQVVEPAVFSTDEACTDGAEKLLEKEASGDLSDLEAAALDALRAVCDENGTPIAGPPAPDPIVQTLFVGSQDGNSQSFDDSGQYSGDDDEYESHETEDHEDDHYDDGYEHESDD